MHDNNAEDIVWILLTLTRAHRLTCSERDADDVVAKSPREVLSDLGEGGSAELNAVDDLGEPIAHEHHARGLS